jgi:hypothetical protein
VITHVAAPALHTGLLPVAQVDHLVVAAATLQEGVAWCEAALGVTPAPGGSHPFMGTHNRLLRLAGPAKSALPTPPAFAQTYLEIIAIEPGVVPTRAARLRRWFDLDDAHLRDALARHGPRLVHFVARVPQVLVATHALQLLGIERGAVLDASRLTPAGLLQWRITVRDDGQRLFYGALPTLIEWGDVHPADTLPESGVTLHSLVATHPRVEALSSAWKAVGLMDDGAVRIESGKPELIATLLTPRGVVTLESGGV